MSEPNEDDWKVADKWLTFWWPHSVYPDAVQHSLATFIADTRAGAKDAMKEQCAKFLELRAEIKLPDDADGEAALNLAARALRNLK